MFWKTNKPLQCVIQEVTNLQKSLYHLSSTITVNLLSTFHGHYSLGRTSKQYEEGKKKIPLSPLHLPISVRVFST